MMSHTIESFFSIKEYEAEKDFIIYSFSTNHLDSIQVSTKRLSDLILSFAFLIFIGSWLFIILAILIKLESKGPVIFKQLRHGYRNQPFYCYKFRSMKTNGNGRLHQAQKNDPQITRVGKFLRMTSLDEMPQLFNIIKGEMSIVGPRPHTISKNEAIPSKIKSFMCRHMVKPGVTGMERSKGLRGEIRNDQDLNFRLKYELFYIKNWSISLDFVIIFWTIKRMILKNKNSY